MNTQKYRFHCLGLPHTITNSEYTGCAYTQKVLKFCKMMNASGGARTVNFYTSVSNSGNKITVKKTDSSTNAVTLDPNSSQTIDGSTTVAITAQYTSLTCISDGSNWLII